MSSASRTVKNKRVLGIAVGAIAMLGMAAPSLSQEGPKDEVFKLTTTIQAPGSPLTSFDISWTDPVLNKYFLADRSNKAIDVVDPSNNSISHFVNPGFAGVNPAGNDFSGPDGVLTANNHTELWVGDSPGKLWVMNATTGAVKTLPSPATNPISVGGTTRADELCYDSNNNLIMVASPGENPPYVTFISTKTYQVVAKLPFDGTTGNTPKATNGLEQCGWSAKTGMFYQNVPEINGPGDDSVPGGVAVIDPKSALAGEPKVSEVFPVPIDSCAGPQGMAIGPSNQILLGCAAASPDGHSNIAIINANSGAVEAVLPDIGGADEVWFNEGDGHYFVPGCNAACRAAPPTPGQEILAVVDSRGFQLDQTVVVANKTGLTAPGASRRIHSAAADIGTNQVYVPVPAQGGGTPIFDASICAADVTHVGTPTAATGCIAVFAPSGPEDRPRLAQERPADDDQQ